MSSTSRILASALLLLAAPLLSCGEALPESLPCESNSDCAPGEVCFEDGCGSPLDFAVRVSPVSGSEAVTQDFSSISMAMDSIQLDLRRPGILRGKVSINRDGTPVPFTEAYSLQARGRSSVIPGLPFDQTFTRAIKTGEDFSFQVPAGIWDVSAIASDPTVPPVYAEKLVASGNSVDPELIFAAGSARVLELRAMVEVPSAPVVPKFRVQVFDKFALTPLSQAVTVVGGEEFTLWSLKTSSAATLRVSLDPTSPVPAPSKEFDPDSSGQFPGILRLGDYGEPIEVAGSVVSDTGEKIPDADVRAEGTVRGGARFTATARSDANGTFHMLLFPTEGTGSYTVTAQPPLSSTFAASSLKAPVEAAKTLAPVVCKSKRTLRGVVTVVSASKGSNETREVALANALIHYEGNPAASDPGASKGDVRTDDNGFFSADVEPGAYRIIAKPSADRRLPWATRRVHTSEPFVVPIRISAPREVTGKLTDWNGKPVSSAVVTLYRVASDATDESTPPETVFEALTDSSGNFKVVVPKAPESGD